MIKWLVDVNLPTLRPVACSVTQMGFKLAFSLVVCAINYLASLMTDKGFIEEIGNFGC